MRYIIIGGGISGLSIARILSKDNEVFIFEKEERPGGMVKCDIVEGSLFHRTGGHVFNTKRQDVSNWFWSHFNKDKEFLKTERNASVHIFDNFVPYPIENYIYKFPENIGEKVIRDLLNLKNEADRCENFEDFLKSRFGETLYHIYFNPYNKKIWGRSLDNVPLSWLEGKLPMPSVNEILMNNIYRINEKKFVHSSFFYPKTGGSQFIVNRLSEGLKIFYNSPVTLIEKKHGKWIVNGLEGDRIIFCGNIKHLPLMLNNNNFDITEFNSPIDKLEYHGTTTVFCEIDKNPYSWIYQPSSNHKSHRIICTGNFSENNNAPEKFTATIEFTDYIEEEEIKKDLEKIPYNPQYIKHNFEKYTYPIQNKDTREMIKALQIKLNKEGLYLCGRFAEWEYSNMDVCIGSALDLSKNLN